MARYRIEVKGHLDAGWQTAFPDVEFEYELTDNAVPITVMSGEIPDQSALYGLINKLWGMGVEVISFQPDDLSDER